MLGVIVPKNRLQDSMRPSTPRAKRKGTGENPFPILETPGGEKPAIANTKKKGGEIKKE